MRRVFKKVAMLSIISFGGFVFADQADLTDKRIEREYREVDFDSKLEQHTINKADAFVDHVDSELERRNNKNKRRRNNTMQNLDVSLRDLRVEDGEKHEISKPETPQQYLSRRNKKKSSLADIDKRLEAMKNKEPIIDIDLDK